MRGLVFISFGFEVLKGGEQAVFFFSLFLARRLTGEFRFGFGSFWDFNSEVMVQLHHSLHQLPNAFCFSPTVHPFAQCVSPPPLLPAQTIDCTSLPLCGLQ